MHRPSGDLEALRAATRRFLRTIDELTDEQARTPSRLPNWNRAEVITHVARNADGIRGMVEAAARDEVLAMYPGGVEQRAAGIAAGRDEPAPFLVSDARHACDLLAESWTALPDDGWDRIGVAVEEAADARASRGCGGARSKCITSISAWATNHRTGRSGS